MHHPHGLLRPCFGAGDVPANGALSIRHTTRNFPAARAPSPAAASWQAWP
ncbi:MAG: hypothetical protein ACLTMO_07850 [Faecalibacterium prausnitzii]